MQIAMKLGQYQSTMENNIAKEVAVVSHLETDNTQKVETILQQLKAGNVFEGTILKLENGQVQVGLSNGEVVVAKLQADIELAEGQSLFFQVKSNNGTKIQIAPYMQNNQLANPAILQALQTAGLPQTEKNILLVDSMMQQQMGIDKQNLGQMARLVQQHPEIDVQTLIQLQKMELPLTQEMGAQLKNYEQDSYAITKQMDTLLQEVSQLLSGEQSSEKECFQVNQKVLQILTEEQAENVNYERLNQPAKEKHTVIDQPTIEESGRLKKAGNEQEVERKSASAEENHIQERTLKDQIELVSKKEGEETVVKQRMQKEQSDVDTVLKLSNQREISGEQKTDLTSQAEMTDSKWAEAVTVSSESTEKIEAEVRKNTFGEAEEIQKIQIKNVAVMEKETILSPKELQKLNQKVQQMIQKAYPETTVEQLKKLDFPAKTETEFLQKFAKILQNPEIVDAHEIFENKTYQKLIRNSLQQQWTITPRQVGEKENVSQIYERLQKQLHQLENIVQIVSKNGEQLKNTTAEVRHNLDFMNHINQMYQYIQIPLKLSGQTVHSDLYVYTNRRGGIQEGENLSAFLHLDLDALGTTDIAVQMKGKHVETQFYLSDTISSQLLESHSDTLKNMLEKKGYSCTIQIENKEKQIHPLEHFLQDGSTVHTGKLHRYSFDMKA